jgi:hypothetical protein
MPTVDYYSAKISSMTNQELDYYWGMPTADIFRQVNNLESEEERERLQEVGLSSSEANLRLGKKENRPILFISPPVQKVYYA